MSLHKIGRHILAHLDPDGPPPPEEPHPAPNASPTHAPAPNATPTPCWTAVMTEGEGQDCKSTTSANSSISTSQIDQIDHRGYI
jgi:hypothetical protein